MSYKSLVALPVFLGTLAVFDVFYSFPLLGVEALGLPFSPCVCDGSAKQAVGGDAAVWSSELVVGVRVGWVIGALAFSLVDRREINRYEDTLLLLPTYQCCFSIYNEFLGSIRRLYNNVSHFYGVIREFKLFPGEAFIPGVIDGICCFLITCHNNQATVITYLVDMRPFHNLKKVYEQKCLITSNQVNPASLDK